jgi:hypothetical protein
LSCPPFLVGQPILFFGMLIVLHNCHATDIGFTSLIASCAVVTSASRVVAS